MMYIWGITLVYLLQSLQAFYGLQQKPRSTIDGAGCYRKRWKVRTERTSNLGSLWVCIMQDNLGDTFEARYFSPRLFCIILGRYTMRSVLSFHYPTAACLVHSGPRILLQFVEDLQKILPLFSRLSMTAKTIGDASMHTDRLALFLATYYVLFISKMYVLTWY